MHAVVRDTLVDVHKPQIRDLCLCGQHLVNTLCSHLEELMQMVLGGVFVPRVHGTLDMGKNIANCPNIPQFLPVKCALHVLCACCAQHAPFSMRFGWRDKQIAGFLSTHDLMDQWLLGRNVSKLATLK